MREIRAHLINGPYDGDAGIIPAPAVPRLWAYPCADPRCPAYGVHWCIIYDELPDGEVGAAYDLVDGTPDLHTGVYDYVYSEDQPSGVVRRTAVEVTSGMDAPVDYMEPIREALRRLRP